MELDGIDKHRTGVLQNNVQSSFWYIGYYEPSGCASRNHSSDESDL